MKTLKTILKSTPAIIASIVVVVGVTYAAGSLTAPSGPVEATSYTLGDILSKIQDITFTPSSHDVSTTTSATTTFASIDDIYTELDAASTTVVAGNIKSGETILGVTGSLTAGISYPTQWSADDPTGYVTWATAVAYCAALTEGGASPGDWHLPTYIELVNAFITSNTPIPNNSLGFQSAFYWSSTEYPNNTDVAYYVSMNDGYASYDDKSNPYGYARCAR